VGVGTGGTITGTARYLKERNPGLVVVGADPAGSIYTAPTADDVKGYLVEGVGEDFWPKTFDPSVVDRWIQVSDRDSFLTTRRLAVTEGILTGGSCGLALHAALEVADGIDDPAAMVAVILPDGGRSYVSKIYNDAWMTEYGFLERSAEECVGDVLLRKQDDTIPGLVTVRSDQPVREAVSLLHEHRVSQLPVVSTHDANSVVGSIGERGVLKYAVTDADVLGAPIVDVMEPPFPAVPVDAPVREAIELLSGERQALLVMRDGRPAGILTRADLLESLAR
jgi:cystathionine beta-synthase